MSSRSEDDSRLMFLVEKLSKDVEDIKEEIKELNNNLYNPHDGIYTRIKEVEHRTETSKDKFANIKQFAFMVLGIVLTTIGSLFIKLIQNI